MKRLFLAFLFCATSVLAQEQTFAPGPFHRLSVSGSTRIELTQGERDQVTVVGDDKVMKNIRLRHEAGRLHISTEEDWKFWNRDPVQLRITMKDLTRISISGASDIVAPRPIRAEDLRLDISGAGEVKLAQLVAKSLRFNISGAGTGEIGAGSVEDLHLNVAGKGRLVMDKLRAKDGLVNISGVGNADVWVTDDLRVTVSGVGTVNYWGQPKLRQDISAIASINARGNR
jgi:hypothetical protein